eukprot:scaffold364_cov401-Prasinococcus_capsulatus_cf.AAC.3
MSLPPPVPEGGSLPLASADAGDRADGGPATASRSKDDGSRDLRVAGVRARTPLLPRRAQPPCCARARCSRSGAAAAGANQPRTGPVCAPKRARGGPTGGLVAPPEAVAMWGRRGPHGELARGRPRRGASSRGGQRTKTGTVSARRCRAGPPPPGASSHRAAPQGADPVAPQIFLGWAAAREAGAGDELSLSLSLSPCHSPTPLGVGAAGTHPPMNRRGGGAGAGRRIGHATPTRLPTRERGPPRQSMRFRNRPSAPNE